MKTFLAAGLTILAGAALLEAALIPGLVIGGAAVLAPKYLPGLRRRVKSSPKAKGRRQAEPAGDAQGQPNAAGPIAYLGKLGMKQAVAKTVTFRVLVTTLDFTSNYVVIGELGTAAGLSTFGLVVGPLLYLSHEAVWNYFGPAEDANVQVPLSLRPDADGSPASGRQFTMSRALAKTITFRTIATVVDFTTLYVVVGDIATAVGLSAFAFVIGPFVYLGHEKLWDYYGSPKKASEEPTLLLPAPTKSVPAPA
jgi:uncharacterized membrane protein